MTAAPRLVDAQTSEPTEYVRALDRGLAVIRAFDRDHPRRTLAEVARAVGLAPATARRLLHTLQAQDYVSTDGQTWVLRPRVLELGQAYLATTTVWDVVRDRLARLAAEVEETASAGVLEGTDVLYTVRVPYRRIMSMNVEVGTRIPAFASSMGRVLLAALPPAELDAVLAAADLAPITPQTVTTPAALRAVVDQVRESGVCVLEQELEAGVQCVAAPVHGADGSVVAAVTVSSHTTRVSPAELRSRLRPALLQAAADITEDLRHRG
ncbi:IclR family transcriptional regulator domain-containing protein [Klenkia brasiliensis]|uniref:Transcriptional regulator, IclR family n=1 Tax=Klenkia brasiliensis TaxID=333142 RepID=A0A1G7WFZ9_9ACTN|nr:IclR family transcriptional regulator C-terminal domain-containing protein [Klenkia brasiliensis]SDG70862.1 transcriptional regulator, IclR family [Klenkia brasiliensis]